MRKNVRRVDMRPTLLVASRCMGLPECEWKLQWDRWLKQIKNKWP